MLSNTSWRNYHIYYSDLNELILDCVYPLLQKYDARLDTFFWERHYAGGPHLRVRLRGYAEALEPVCEDFLAEVRHYLAMNPSKPLSNYSSDSVKSMLEMEGEETLGEGLDYRVNEVAAVPYQRLHHRLASDEAARLLEDFLHSSMPLVAAILRSHRPVREEVLRLYFAHALIVTGEVPRGCVAYKSHWEGFASHFSIRALISRIENQYERDRDQIREIMLSVDRDYRRNSFDRDPVLGRWQALSGQYGARAMAILRSGDQITHQAKSVEEVRTARKAIMESMVEDSDFIRTLFRDERFLALIQFHHDFLWPRVITNLLYQVVAAAGLPMIEKMAMCYFAHRAAEDYWKCDLVAILEETIQTVINEHSARISES